MANRLKEKYLNEVVPALTEQFNYSSVMAVPKVDKIVLNMGVGEAVSNAKSLEKAAEELALISGQKPLITKAKKSIAGFRLREGVANFFTVYKFVTNTTSYTIFVQNLNV